MTRKLTTVLSVIALIGGASTATLWAGDAAPAAQTPPAAASPAGQGSMMGHGSMGQGGMTGMMDMMGKMTPEQMKQMMRMVEHCNRMMDRMEKLHTGTDHHQRAPESHK